MYVLLRRLLDAHRQRDLASLSIARGDANMLATVLSRLRKNNTGTDHFNEKLQQLVSSIASEPANTWTLQSMAQMIGVSERNLFRVFKKEYGCSPMEMVIRQRLNRAIQLLSDNQDRIATIAASCGYESVYSFTRLFRKHVGFQPAQYRKRLHGKS
jgi:transcriptional regulator GlxA family with amidase domain